MSGKRNVLWVWSALVVWCVSGILWGATYTVDPGGQGDFTIIQTAINASSTGDVIQIVPGTYYVNVHGDPNDSIRIDKAITLTSTSTSNDPTLTIIDGNDINDANDDYCSVIVVTTSGEGCVISNLTIQNGNAKDISGITEAGKEYSYENDNNWNKGGGISGWKQTVGDLTYNPVFTVKNCIVQDNYASRTGGGIWGCAGTIEDCLIRRNECGYPGIVTGSIDVADYGNGGGISFEEVETPCSAKGKCSCQDPNSCLYLWLTVKNCTISNNLAGKLGGGVFANNYTGLLKIAVTGCDIIGNEVYCIRRVGVNDTAYPGSYGAGVAGYGTGMSNFFIADCDITDNEINVGNGKGAGCYYVMVEDSLIKDNINKWGCNVNDLEYDNIGGGLWGCEAFNCTIQGNQAEIGGGCYYSSLFDCKVLDNDAYHGGGFYGMAGTEAEGCFFSGNTSDYGGAIFGAPEAVLNCLIVGNEATSNGGGIFTMGSVSRFSNCTISGNKASAGAGLCAREGSVATDHLKSYWDRHVEKENPCVVNSIIFGNIISDVNALLDNIEYSCFSEATSTNHNISTDPNFVDPGYWEGGIWNDGVYHLLPTSPCIDTGDPNSQDYDKTAFFTFSGFYDLDGLARIWDGDKDGIEVIDMGAYEAHGLAIHFGLDGDATDISGNNHHGTENGNPTYSEGGIVLDGVDDYVEIQGYQGVTGTASRTCSFWVKTTDGSPTNILSWGANDYGAKWTINCTDGIVSVYVYGGNVIGSTAIHDGGWHHIAVVLKEDGTPNADDIKIYIDGVEDTISSSTPYVINTGNANNVKIGRWLNPLQSYTGQLDDVRIYNRALRSDEISNLNSIGR